MSISPRLASPSGKAAYEKKAAEEKQKAEAKKKAAEDAAASKLQSIARGRKLLAERLSSLGLQKLDVRDDGACQFRSLSLQLFERAHPLEFPMGIGGLHDELRDDESSPLRPPGARVCFCTVFET